MTKKFSIHLLFTAVIAGTLALSACNKKDEPSEADELDQIQQMIDHQQYDQADHELRKILAKDPKNNRARTILGSVYVHKAGISVREFFLLESLFRNDQSPVKPLINIDVLEKLELKKDSQFQKAVAFLKQINSIAIDSQKISEKFQKIPLLEDKAASDIYQALIELEELDKPTRGMSLYRGVIKLIYFKYMWETNQLLSIGEGRLCSSSMTKLNKELETLRLYTVGMVNDIAMGVPGSEVEFKKKALALNSSMSKAQTLISNLGSMQMTVAEVINQVVQTAEIKGFKCSF